MHLAQHTLHRARVSFLPSSSPISHRRAPRSRSPLLPRCPSTASRSATSLALPSAPGPATRAFPASRRVVSLQAPRRASREGERNRRWKGGRARKTGPKRKGERAKGGGPERRRGTSEGSGQGAKGGDAARGTTRFAFLRFSRSDARRDLRCKGEAARGHGEERRESEERRRAERAAEGEKGIVKGKATAHAESRGRSEMRNERRTQQRGRTKRRLANKPRRGKAG